MAVLADLSAGAYGRPGVNHGVFADVRADVDKTRHQNDTRCNIGALADNSSRNTADTGFCPVVRAEVLEAKRDLVVETHVSCTHNAVRINSETEKNRFFDPLMSNPFAVDFFGDSEFSGFKLADDFIDRVGHLGRKVLRLEFKSVFNHLLQR